MELLRVHGAFAIEQATSRDFADLVALRNLEDWAPNAWLFSALEASELGHVVVARWESGTAAGQGQHRPIAASAVGTAYGAMGVIGNVIVQASHRARGLGRAVMEAQLAWLRQRDVAYVELDATEHGRPLYEKLGFVERAPSWMLVDTVGRVRGQQPTAASAGAVRELTAATLASVTELDRVAFGGGRMSLLAAVLALPETRGWVMVDARGVATGYLYVRPAEHRSGGMRIGPWIAHTPQVALGLLHQAVKSAEIASNDAPLVASVPGASRVVTGCFADAGMPLVPDDVRMRLTFARAVGEVSRGGEAKREDWVYGMLAPMVG